MSLADRLAGLRLARTARRDAAEEERLLKLYWNRAELKRTLGDLEEEVHQLKAQLKQQQAATQRSADQVESLEVLLGNVEQCFGALVHYGLRGLWRAGRAQLEQFSSELRRQQEDRERKAQLQEYHGERTTQLAQATARLEAAEAAVASETGALATLEQEVASLTAPWHYFKRNERTAALEAQRARVAQSQQVAEDLRHSRRALEKTPLSDFSGLSLEGRRAINLSVLALAQVLLARLSRDGLAQPARAAWLRPVQEVRYGSRADCLARLAEVQAGLAWLREPQGLAQEVKLRTERLRQMARYRYPHETIPEAGSLPTDQAGESGVALRAPNVLTEDYFELRRYLIN